MTKIVIIQKQFDSFELGSTCSFIFGKGIDIIKKHVYDDPPTNLIYQNIKKKYF